MLWICFCLLELLIVYYLLAKKNILGRYLISCVAATCSLLGMATIASASEPHELEQWLTEFKPPGIGRPERTGNGSSRRPLNCSPDEPVVTPLLPADRFGLTLQERPQIFVDISATSAKQVFLTFRGESTEDYHQTMLPIADQVGRVGFGLPNDVPALTPGVTYQWSLTLVCGDFITLNDPIVTGWVHRTEPDPGQPAAHTLGSRAQWLSEHGYWYDLVDLVVDRS